MRRSPQRLACAAIVVLPSLLGLSSPGTAAQLVGPFAKRDYPQAVIDRPLTLPAGMVEVEIGGRFVSRRFEEPVLGVGGADDWLADVAVRVGVTDRIQLEAGTSFSLDHELRDVTPLFQPIDRFDPRATLTSWQRVVPLRLSLLALDTDTLDTALTLTLPFVAHSERTFRYFVGRGSGSITVTNSDGRVLPLVQLAAPTRWRLCDYFWFRAGENLFAVTTGNGTAQFAFDLGVGIQPHPIFAVTLDSRISSIRFDGSGNEDSTTLADRGTIDLEGTFSPLPWFDVVGALVAPDVGDGLDNYLARMALRFRF